MAQKNKKNTGFIVGGIVLLVIAVMNIPFSIIAEPDCIFTEAGDECIINVPMPNNREFSLYSMDLSFRGLPSGVYTEEKPAIELHQQTFTGISKESWGTRYEIHNLKLYGIPDFGIEEIAKVRIFGETTGTATCNYESSTSFDSMGISFTGYLVSKEYPHNTIISQAYKSGIVMNSDNLMEIETNAYGTHLYFKNLINLYRKEFIHCFGKETRSATHTYNFETEVSQISTNKDNIKFITGIVLYKEKNGIATYTEPTVFMQIQEMEYPTNLKVGVDTINLQTIIGKQVEPIRTLDISQQMNAYCSGKTDCIVPIVFKSDARGEMFIKVDKTERIKETPIQDTPTEPVTETPIIAPTPTGQAPNIDSPIADAPVREKKSILQRIIEWIKNITSR